MRVYFNKPAGKDLRPEETKNENNGIHFVEYNVCNAGQEND